jgi:RNA polymerase sigma-70 factor (ECF subfamily)
MKRHDGEIAELLENTAWIRGLAQRLAAGAASAEDLEQDTWTAALERPRMTGGALRGWLSRVLRNRARDLWRDELHRADREQLGARPEALPSTAEIVERAALQRRVVHAVWSLDEHERDVVLLRFFEGLPPREIAKRLAVPLETVKSRQQRALAKLRERLDNEYPDGRAAWIAVLLGNERVEPRGVGPTASANMLLSLKLALWTLPLVIAGSLWWLRAQPARAPEASALVAATNPIREVAAEPPLDLAANREERVDAASSFTITPVEQPSNAQVDTCAVLGTVTIAGPASDAAQVVAKLLVNGSPMSPVQLTATPDASGAFRFQLDVGQSYVVFAFVGGLRPASRILVVPAQPELVLDPLVLAPGERVQGFLSMQSGVPLESAVITARFRMHRLMSTGFGVGQKLQALAWTGSEFEWEEPEATVHEGGAFEFLQLAPGKYDLRVTHLNGLPAFLYPPASVIAPMTDFPLSPSAVLVESRFVRGPIPVAATSVSIARIENEKEQMPEQAFTDSEGRLRMWLAPQSTYALTVFRLDKGESERRFEIAVPPGQPAPFEFDLGADVPPATLTLLLSGVNLPQLDKTAVEFDEGGRSSFSLTPVLMEGEWRLQDIPPGDYFATLRLDRDRSASVGSNYWLNPKLQVHLEPQADVRIPVALTLGGRLRIDARDSDGTSLDVGCRVLDAQGKDVDSWFARLLGEQWSLVTSGLYGGGPTLIWSVLPPGSYTVEVTRAGFVTQSVSTLVSAGETRDVVVVLEKTP